jgi:hypothetical protein
VRVERLRSILGLRRKMSERQEPLDGGADEMRGTCRNSIDLRSLFDNPTAHDCVLELTAANGEQSLLPAHRVVLIASSTYFSSLFSGAWETHHQQKDAATAAATSSSSGPTSVGDETLSTRRIHVNSDEVLSHLRLFFAFLYGVELELDLTTAHPLLRLSDFYGVDALMTQCLRFLERVLNPQPTRCFTLFESSSGQLLTQPPPQERLIQLCTEVLARSFAEASAHVAFRKCPEELLAAVLERDDLSVDKESEVLQALVSWAEADLSRRAASLDRLLALVRWPLMDPAFLADVEDTYTLLCSQPDCASALRSLLLEAFKFQATSGERRSRLLEVAQSAEDAARRLRPRTPNMVRLQGEGKFCWSLKNFSRLAADERIYSPPFVFSGIAFMLLFFPRGNQQREYASLYVSIADKTKLPAGWRRDIHFSLSVIDQRESLCSVTKSTHGELTTQVLDWGFTELLPLATLHSTDHGYILDDALQFTITFERITEGASVSGRGGRASASMSPSMSPSSADAPIGIVTNRHV